MRISCKCIDTVVKLGGGLLAHAAHFDAALAAIAAAARARRLLVVPGGGPFAEAVRHVDRDLHLSDDAAHWMAVLAMDQYAHLVASRLAGGVIVEELRQIDAAVSRSTAGSASSARSAVNVKIPVLAPYRWLRETDPLPHSWAVTSDSIAAWVAGQVGAHNLVLVKPPNARGRELVDSHFRQALPAHITSTIVAADEMEALNRALGG
jgi:aspartokinase-like uncharacterized kinase